MSQSWGYFEPSSYLIRQGAGVNQHPLLDKVPSFWELLHKAALVKIGLSPTSIRGNLLCLSFFLFVQAVWLVDLATIILTVVKFELDELFSSSKKRHKGASPMLGRKKRKMVVN